jgi:hypothetical protein
VHAASASSTIGDQELKLAHILRDFAASSTGATAQLANRVAAGHYRAYLSARISQQLRQPRPAPLTVDPVFDLNAKLRLKLWLYRRAPGLLRLYRNSR